MKFLSKMRFFSIATVLLVNLFYLEAILIEQPPTIIKQPPTDEILCQGDAPVLIECEAEAEPLPKYRWIKNGKPFDWETYDYRISQQPGRGTLLFTKFEKTDVGLYQCFAENKLGVATSNAVFLRNVELESFQNVGIASLTGNEDEPFRLNCETPGGYPKPTISWTIQYLDGRFKSINSSRITADPEGTLWFSSLKKDDSTDGFTYACAASSAKFEYKIGNRVHLSVIPSGSALSKPVLQYVSRKNEIALRGKDIKLFCIFGGKPVPQIEWSKNGQVIKQSDRVYEDNYGKTLIIKLVDFNDEGRYTCKADNGVGSSQTYSINLDVLAVPYFTTEPVSITAAPDETAEIECDAAGVPEPKITWLYNGKPIEEARPNPRRSVGPQIIVIQNLTKPDVGNYGCNASNSLGYVYKDVFVNVLSLPPQFIEPLNDKQVVVGEDISLRCKAFGAPKPDIKWFHNNHQLHGDRFTVSQTNGDLHIKSVTAEDAGTYECHAANKFGMATSSLLLEVTASI